jgi:ADP-glucose pyrophosphorylase
VIGEKTTVGEFANIQCSVIGRNCSIGNHVTITNSFIWDNTVIEDGVVIDHSLVCRDVTIKKNSHLQPGCIVSFDVVIGPDHTVERETKLTMIEDPVLRYDEEADEGPLVAEVELGEEIAYKWLEDYDELSNSLGMCVCVWRCSMVVT